MRQVLSISLFVVIFSSLLACQKEETHCWECRYIVLYVTGDTLGYNDYVMCDVTEEHMEKSLIEINAQDPNQITVCTKQ
jgi:hypothetical protein